MARVQTEYQGRGEQLQAVSAPQIQAVQARFDPNDSGAFQLAKALGAVNTEGLTNQINATALAKTKADRLAAETYANGLTVEELGKRIKDGNLLPSQSPTFMAALQHIHGENSQNTFERDTLSKIQSGELQFKSQEEIDKYLTEGRNKTLEGQSQYTIAGFDKGYNTFREKATNANTQLVNQKATERGLQESSDKLGNDVLKVTSPDFKGSTDDAAKTILGTYKLLTTTSLLRDDARKAALDSVITSLASSGRKELADNLLNQKLDSGVTIRAVLGETRAASLSQHAESQNDKLQNQRVDVEIRPFLEQADKGELDAKGFQEYVAKNERYLKTPTIHAITQANEAAQERARKALEKGKLEAASAASEAEAARMVDVAAASGNLAFLPQQKVLTKQGELTDFDTKEAAQQALTRRGANMSLSQQTQMWATNNVENPEWKKEILGGASNVTSVGWSYDGKAPGALNPQGKKALDTFMRINATHPGYAEKLAGNEYKALSDIQFLIEKGGYGSIEDPSAAAALVNQVNRSNIKTSDYGSMTKAVSAAVDDVVNPHWYSGRVAWFDSLFGNGDTNLTSMHSDIRRRAELMILSGQVKDPAQAVSDTVKYLANPAVTTKINNTLYYNKDLPPVPAGQDASKLFERFIKEVPGASAKEQKLDHKDVRLEPNAYGGFTAMIGGTPLTGTDGKVQVYRKEDVTQWIGKTIESDRKFAGEFANFTSRVADPLEKEFKRRGVNQDDLYLRNNLLTEDGFKQVQRDGNAGKPIAELMQIYKRNR